MNKILGTCLSNKVLNVVSRLFIVASLVLGTQALTASDNVDFDEALRGLNFDLATIDASSAGGNGILDAHEMALVAAVLNDPFIDNTETGGVSHAQARTAYDTALESAKGDFAVLISQWPTASVVGAGYSMLGQATLDTYAKMAAAFGAPMQGDYSAARAMAKYFASSGDADGDGVSNLEEYNATIAHGREVYIKAALDAEATAGSSEYAYSTKVAEKKTVGVILYPGFEVLDVFGPIEMWAYVPEFEVITIAEEAGSVASAQQDIKAVADYSFETAPKLDIVMVPGGVGTHRELHNESFLSYLRDVDTTTEWTISVCTGSALLAKAGLLKNRKATSNKAFFSLATEQDPSVDWQGSARWVEDGKYITSSGVSAGTDMALALVAKYHGKEHASHLASAVEYVWNDDPDNDPFAIEYNVK